ncbi:MAG TPA: hypothetical protein VFE47_26490 [Tepidisphaeraceae bacterium]|jgi:hypothetical protein|nr:hypothetical protein [Tepidisphaeraceae bacterium]
MSRSAHFPLAAVPNPRLGLALLIGLICLVAAGKPILSDTMDPDCFWHLRVAEQLRDQLHNGRLGPLVDNLSFASVQDPWTPYSWLAELGMDALWRTAGWRAAIFAHAFFDVAFVLFIALACRTRPTRDLSDQPHHCFTTNQAIPGALESALATAAAAILSLAYLSFRPVTAALVLMAMCGWLLIRDRRSGEQSKAVWLVLPVTALMINLHLYAIFIPMWIAALWIGAILERRKAGPEDRPEAERRVARYSWLLAGSGVACLATPMLPGVIGAALRYQSIDPMVASGVIGEMKPFYHGFAGIVSAAIVLIMAGCLIVGRKQLRVGDWLWLALATALLFRLGRFAPHFAIVAAPIFALTIPRLSSRILNKPVICLAMAAVLLIGTVRVAMAFPRGATTLDAWLQRQGPDGPGYPCAAADYIATSVKPTTGRLINEFTWGGFLEWRFKNRYQTLLDGRTQLFSPQFWQATYLGSEQERSAYLSSIHADAALLPMQHSVFEETLRKQGWQIAYRDERAMVLVPPPPTISNKANSPKWPFASLFLGE